jgi:hypothetical protein
LLEAALTILLAALAAPPRVLDGERLRILYPERLAGMARILRDRIPVLLQEVEGELGERLERPILVRLAVDDGDFSEIVGPGAFRYAAVAFPARDELALKASAIQIDAPLPAIVRHELAHLVLYHLLRGRRLPLWMEEGLAEIAGGAFPVVTAEELPAAVAAGRIRPLDDLATRFPEDPDDLGIAYRQSESFVRFLRTEAGPGGLRAILLAIRDGASADDAIFRVTGSPRAELEARWRATLEDQNPFWLVLLRSHWIEALLCACGLLTIVAFARYRVRRRRLLREMDAEELIEPPDPGTGV